MNIDDREACAVYADYLLEQGDSLGELMAAHLRGDPITQRQLEAIYLESHFSFLRAPQSHLDVTWKNGLFDRLSVGTYLGVETVKAIASTPAARFLRALEFSMPNRKRWHSKLQALESPLPALVEHPLPRTLRALDLQISTLPERKPIDLAPIYPQLQELTDFRVQVSHSVFGRMDLPSLRSLSTSLDTPTGAHELAAAKLPRLERLRLESAYWSFLEYLDVPSAPDLERLTLGISYDRLQGDAYLIMADAPLVKRIRVLELAHVRREDSDLLTLVAPKLLHLTELRVRREQIHEEERAELTRILGSRVVFE